MSSSDYREPTNDELWTQPPTTAGHVPSPHGLVPMPPPPLPAPMHSLPPAVPTERPDRTVFVLAIVTTALGIPLTAIASGTAGLAGLLIAWVGIVLVNVVYARSRRGK
jgi:hypothetical protein